MERVRKNIEELLRWMTGGKHGLDTLFLKTRTDMTSTLENTTPGPIEETTPVVVASEQEPKPVVAGSVQAMKPLTAAEDQEAKPAAAASGQEMQPLVPAPVQATKPATAAAAQEPRPVVAATAREMMRVIATSEREMKPVPAASSVLIRKRQRGDREDAIPKTRTIDRVSQICVVCLGVCLISLILFGVIYLIILWVMK